MYTPLQPARLELDERGTPISTAYGDVYHAQAGALGQAAHVFLAGNGLPERWRGQDRFTILETGFGLGLNFLATWRAWRDDPQRAARLDFVSVEKHPFRRDDLARLYAAYPELAELTSPLLAAWPPLTPGLHCLEFEGGRVRLWLALGDAEALLPRLGATADALYLDGFAPAKNPDLWSLAILKALARRARVGTTLATWATAGEVRRNLAAAGFVVDKRPGYGGKREMSCGRYAPRWPVPAPLWTAVDRPERSVVVVGAGIAGSAAAERLATRGYQVTVLDAGPHPGAATSGNPVGAFGPVVARDDAILARLTRAATYAALRCWQELGLPEGAAADAVWGRCGTLELPKSAAARQDLADTVAALQFPPDFVQLIDAAAASELAGARISEAALHFPLAGWVRPPLLCAALLAARPELIRFRPGIEVERLERTADGWRLFDRDGQLIAETPIVVLANAGDAGRLGGQAAIELRRIRGQITLLPADRFAGPRLVLKGDGYVLPARAGSVVTGATYDFASDTTPDPAAHHSNLERLAELLPDASELPATLDPASLDGRIGFRCVTIDRLPAIGPLADETAVYSAAHGGTFGLGGLPRQSGLYGAFAYASRGMTWAMLGGEILAARIDGGPAPVETDLLAAVDPGRFILRRWRQHPVNGG